MKHQEGNFVGCGGMELYFQSWHPDETAKGVLILVHGLCEHSGRYSNVVNHLTGQGFAVYSFDHRGHGRSCEKLGAHVNSWSEYHKDVGEFLKLVRGKEADLPLFLMGHSMGGLIVLEYALDHPEGLKGVIASGPAVGAVDAPPVLLFIGRVLSKITPSFSLKTGLNTEAISRDPLAVKAYQDDPMVSSIASARWSVEFTKAIEKTRARAAEFNLPLLIIHGEADKLVPPEGSQYFFEQVQYSDKERIVYEGGYHEPHNDIQHEQVTADIQRWLEAHL